jgi:pimeloyl-ACP methyl ester carboxylesterase
MAQPAKHTIVLFTAPSPTLELNGVGRRAQKAGYKTVAVANPLRACHDARQSPTSWRRIADPVVLVGHSYGGQVISNAAKGHDNVKSLVYVAAFALTGEAAADLAGKFPGGTLGEALTPR